MDTNKERVYAFLIKYKVKHDGISPSLEEIMNATAIKSASHVNKILKSLEDDGLLRRRGGHRNIDLLGAWLPPLDAAKYINSTP